MNMQTDYQSGVPFAKSVEEKLTVFVNSSAIPQPVSGGTLFGIVFEIGVLGLAVLFNSFLVFGIARSPRLQAPIFQLMLGVASADLILTACATLRVYDHFSVEGQWIFGRAGCAILKFLDYLLPQVVGCLLLISCCERFYAVCRPASFQWGTSRRIVVIIILIWIGNTAICAPLLVHTAIGRATFSDGFAMATCVMTLGDNVIKLFDTATAMLFYVVTSVMSLLFLGCTVCKAVKASCDNVKDDFKNHVLRCIFIVTVLHILLWLPQRIISFYNWHTSADSAIKDAAILRIARQLVYASCAVKPVVYFTTSGRFRGALLRSLKCCCCCCCCCETAGEPRYQLAASACLGNSEPRYQLAASACPTANGTRHQAPAAVRPTACESSHQPSASSACLASSELKCQTAAYACLAIVESRNQLPSSVCLAASEPRYQVAASAAPAAQQESAEAEDAGGTVGLLSY